MRHDAVGPITDRIVLAHGFTQTARSWRTVTPLLAARLPGVDIEAVDLPGHGDAPAPADGDLWASADRLIDVGGRAVYIGYSMGGRVALHAALSHPDEVTGLVLIGATAGIDDEHERRARRDADERLATRIEHIGTEAFIDEWLQTPLLASLGTDAAMREDRLRNRAADLAASLRATGTGTQDPLWARLAEITCPTLILVGANDVKFTALGRRLADGIDDAVLRVIQGAGHSVHLEQPEHTAAAIADWL